jgi:FkbM family methyltransferase
VSALIKRFIKKSLPLVTGYHSLCLALRKHRPKSWEWVDRIPVKPGIIVLVHSKAGDLYMSRPERCSIAKKYFWTQGIREPEEDRVALDLFANLSKQSNVALDIGANSGLFSLVAAKSNSDSEVIAFDILPEAYHVLIDNLILNNLIEKVETKLIGIGEQGGVFDAPFNNVSSEMPTSLSLDYKATDDQPDGISLDYKAIANDQAQVQVAIKSLDEICMPRFVGKTLCIKIDVEGTEVDIFTHGLETLNIIKPDIICEVLQGARDVDLYDQILESCSYRKFLITDLGLKEFDKIIPDERFKDWFFTTKSDLDIENEGLLK